MDFFKKIIAISYFRFGLIVSITYTLELFMFVYLNSKIEIFWANFFASITGITLDYFISSIRKLNIFDIKKDKKFLYYVIYTIFIFTLVSFNSFLIENINQIINMPIISKLIIIPLSYTINWSFFYFILSKRKV
jgi:hypothetical protein|tara:strand:+ start:854 stop:1255 length:402 start_codon:yes stop_codon:yes gene_type:complete